MSFRCSCGFVILNCSIAVANAACSSSAYTDEPRRRPGDLDDLPRRLGLLTHTLTLGHAGNMGHFVGLLESVRLCAGRRSMSAMTTRACTTLGDLQRSSPWVWLNCERCQHRAPFACAVAVIRWVTGHVERHAAAMRALHRMRSAGRDAAASELGRREHRLHAVSRPEWPVLSVSGSSLEPSIRAECLLAAESQAK
jgi:hypothetical protein